MSRRKKGSPVHGWLVLDKPMGLTSTQALARVKRLFDAQKAGHAGTLDPLATGVLPIAFGEATKTVSFAVDGEKSYAFTVRWGAETDTDDTEGSVTRESALRPGEGDILALLPRFIGEVMQVPPAYSAVKIDGERAYDLARDGEQVVLEARPVVIDDLRLVAMPDRDTAVFEADCGKGTYVRAIARDLGRLLGCFGHVIALRRTRVGPFQEGDAWTIADLETEAEAGTLFSAGGPLMPVELALHDLPELTVNANDAGRLARGMSVLVRGRDAPVLTGLMYATCHGRIVALGEVEKGALHPIRVFNLG
ncbi:MAG: tRNA pseudouridine(55) synthase TruB [Hyphomicrobium sp.]|nr:tRNA pseudouridine(55) synthase TruB [Hyphomicrobium sp.]